MGRTSTDSSLANGVSELLDSLPCRSQQLQLLISLFGQKDHLSVPALFVYGHTCTGKSLVIQSVMDHIQAHYVRLNCIECYNARLIYENVLNSLSGTKPCSENGFKSYSRCDNMNDFVRLFNQILQEQNLVNETLYLIFENAERLRDMDITLLPGLMSFQELTGGNVTVIMESEIVWEKFRGGTGCAEPFLLFFPDYAKDELLEILSMDSPEVYPVSLYRNYLGLLLSIFYHACRDLQELRHLASLNFPKFVEPIEKGEATTDDMKILWRNIEPHLRKALQTVYLREVSSSQWERMQEDITKNSGSSVPALSTRIDLELPFYSKYMLIAAYLGSYNPAKTDKRFFAKHSGKINKRGQVSHQKRTNMERTSNQLLGPKPFPLDRLMAIFYSIMEEKVAPTANVFSQVRSLVSLGLLSQISSSDPLECPKYKCLVSLDFMKSISRTVRFDIIRYLYDFV